MLEAIKDARGPIETPIRASRVASGRLSPDAPWFGVWRGAIRGKAKRPRGATGANRARPQDRAFPATSWSPRICRSRR